MHICNGEREKTNFISIFDRASRTVTFPIGFVHAATLAFTIFSPPPLSPLSVYLGLVWLRFASPAPFLRRLWVCSKILHKAKKKNCYVALTRPKSENWVGRSIFFFDFFFLRTVRELSFSIFFKKFLNGENSGGMQSKRIYKCFFKPLNTNFRKFFAQI